MRIHADLRCLQDECFALRGIGYHASVLLRAARNYLPRGAELIGLVDAGMAPLADCFRELVDRTEIVFAVERPAEPSVFLELSPMTHGPTQVSRLVGQPNVLSCAIVYDFIPLDVAERYLADGRTRREYLSRLAWLAAYDRYFAISQYSARRLIEILAVPSTSVDVTGVALRPAFAQLAQPGLPEAPAEQPAPPITGLPDNYVLFVGGADPRKNVEVLLTAHARLRELHPASHLVIVGHYPPDFAAAIQDRYRRDGGDAARLHLVHGVSDAQLAVAYARAACTVCSSQIEGFSLPVIEAIACGSPLLASRNEAHAELISQPEAMFPPNDAEALTAALRRVLEEPSVRNRLLNEQREVPVRFTMEAVCDRFWLPLLSAARWRAVGRRWGTRATMHGASRSPVVAPPERPRIAILSPFPPDQSGVADYTRRTVQALGRLVDVDVYTDAKEPTPTAEVRRFFPISDRPFLSGNYDATLAVVGNSHFHLKIIEAQQRHGGACLIHDNRLAELYNWWKGADYLRDMASRALNRPVSAEESQGWIANPGTLPSLFFDELVATARPLVVHSRGIQAHCRNQYGIEPACLPFCCYRPFLSAELTPAARLAARQALGIPDDQLAVISLGIVSPTKSPQACIEAVAQLNHHVGGQGVRAHLHFVGDEGGMQETLEKHARAQGVADRTHFSGKWISDDDYRRYVVAADFAIQLRTHFFGGLSGAMLDCISSGLVTVANEDLAKALESPPSVLRVPDNPQPDQIAASLLEGFRAGVHRERLTEYRQQYVDEHNFDRYALELLAVLGLDVGRPAESRQTRRPDGAVSLRSPTPAKGAA